MLHVAAPILVVAATFAAFLPVLRNQFINWDDEANLVWNPHFRGLDWHHLSWMFTTRLMGHWIPVTWVSFGADYLLWGLRPVGYHLTSLLLHAAGSVAFYFVALSVLRAAMATARDAALRLGAATAALFFAIHPLRVESVAWVTERRDVLSGLFVLITVWLYLRAAKDGPRRSAWLGASVACFVLAMLSKAIVMTLPVVLIVLDGYPLRRRAWAEKVPYVVVAVAGAGAAAYAQRAHADPLATRPLAGRLAAAAYGLWFYVWKTVYPVAIQPLYEIPPGVDPLSLPMVSSALAVAAITVGLIVLRKRWPAGLAVWTAYAVMLFPVSGLAQSGPQLVAARYTYLACLGFALLAGAAVCVVARAAADGRIGRGWVRAGAAVALAVLTGLGVLTWRDSRVWRDSGTLWAHAASLDPRSAIAHNNLSVLLIAEGRLEEAQSHLRTALDIRPEYEDARVNLLRILEAHGRPDEARQARFRLGYTLMRVGKLDQAVALFRKEVDARPEDAVARNNLGTALFLRGDVEPAIQQFERALSISSDYAEARRNLDVARAGTRR